MVSVKGLIHVFSSTSKTKIAFKFRSNTPSFIRVAVEYPRFHSAMAHHNPQSFSYVVN